MKGFKKGTELELQDGSKVIIEGIFIERQEISVAETKGEEVETNIYPLKDFQSLLHPSALPDTGFTSFGVGLLFLDKDQALSEIIEITENTINYKKRWGSESWSTSVNIEEFEENFSKGKITIF